MRLNQKQTILLIIAALVTATLVAYEPIRHNSFITVYDDPAYITDNPQVTSGITWKSLGEAFTKPHFFMWHPLTTISHMLDCEIFGLNPAGHHFTSLLLHILNTLLLFYILNSISGTLWLSAFIAGVFALHPVQVESVAWAAERKTVMSGLFWLLTTVAYIHYARQPGFGRYIAVLLVFGLCIMTKPVVVTLPFALLLLDYWPLERIGEQNKANRHPSRISNLVFQKGSIGRLIAEKIPLAVMSVFLSIMTFISQKQGGVVPTLDRMSMDYRLANMFLSYIRYIGKLIWPSGLAICYPHPLAKLSDVRVIICAILFISLTVVIVYYIGRRKKYAVFGWLWYVGTLVPVIGLVQSGAQAMANRYMYIPMLGLLIIVGWGAKDFIGKYPRAKIAAIILGAVVLSSLLALTRMQVRHWENSLTLFEYTLNATKNNPVAENSYGVALFNLGRMEEAEPHLRKAVRLAPAFVAAITNLAKVYMEEGKYNEAVENLSVIIKHNEATADTYYTLATVLSLQNKFDEAIKSFKKALELNPNDPDTYKRLGIVLLVTGRNNGAIMYLNESLRIRPNQVEVYTNLGTAYSQLGQYETAIKNWVKALELQPNSVDVINSMGWLFATSGDVTAEKANQAIGYARRACELTGYNNAEYLDTLGAAFAAAGKFEEAKTTAGKALSIATASGQEKLAGEIENRIKLYETGRPYRQIQKTDDK
jgi:protein O-mannosyl-transferase